MRDLKIVGASIFASFLAAGTVQAESTVGGRYLGLNLGLNLDLKLGLNLGLNCCNLLSSRWQAALELRGVPGAD